MTFEIQNLSLRTKLVLLVTSLLTAITLFISLFFPARLESLSRGWAEHRATTVAAVLAGAVAPGLEFDDAANVGELLGRLEPAEGAVYAVVRRNDRSIFASFHPELVASVGIKPEGRLGVVFSGDLLHVIAPVKGKGGGGGTLTIGFSLTELEQEKHNNRVQMGVVAVGILLVGLVLSFVFGTYFVKPIRRMTLIAQQISKGDLSQPALEIAGRDEVGQMAEAFDAMLRSLRGLSSAADAVAAGNLTGRLEMEGQVAEAFNRMIEAQRVVVREIATTSERLAHAAADMYAASQEQESAATLQSSGVEEVSRTMQSLLESAEHITESAKGVLGNAERTRQTTDLTAAKIAELSGHTNRIGEILEVIRDIADRSDLLALNASIEGTRAGEAGRAFSLVAGEMRRLAERVTASVQDVKALVADVRASGTSTVMATEEGRRLAESTTDSARIITMVTQQQRTGTEQVSKSMNDIAAILSQSVASTKQTRALAEDLKTQAERLAEVVGRFRVSQA